MDAIDATFVSALRDRGADGTTARLATDMAVSIWRVAAERALHSDNSSFAAELLGVARQLRRIAADDPADAEGLSRTTEVPG
jgi:hypothetical protein